MSKHKNGESRFDNQSELEGLKGQEGFEIEIIEI